MEVGLQEYDPLPIKQPTGITLTALIYEELAKHAGEDFSAAELMKAAQKLIKVSRGEYVDKVAQEYIGQPHYYALNLINAFHYPWKIANYEARRINHCDQEEHSLECKRTFQLINLGLDEQIWELEDVFR